MTAPWPFPGSLSQHQGPYEELPKGVDPNPDNRPTTYRSKLAAQAAKDPERRLHCSSCGWRTMATAPKDGSVVLVLLVDSSVPYPVRYVNGGWQMVWDSYRLSEFDRPRYWMPALNDPDA